jgi:YidC/Oxa1 family membrane protein insertase
MTNRLPTPKDPQEHNRMMVFYVIVAIFVILFYGFVSKPYMDRAKEQAIAQAQKDLPIVSAEDVSNTDEIISVDKALAQKGQRIKLDTPKLIGSVNVKGIRFDDLLLKNYYTALDKKELVRLLAPSVTKESNFVEVGLIPKEFNQAVPDNKTQWSVVSQGELTPEEPLLLEWDNGQGLVFKRKISIDQRYVFTIIQSVVNNTAQDVTLYPYARVSETHHLPAKGEKVPFEKQASTVQHVGPLAFLNDELHEKSYSDMKDENSVEYKDVKGWLGMTSKYWLVALFPDQNKKIDVRFTHQEGELKQDIFQVDYRGEPLIVKAQASAKTQMRFFSGAKKLAILNDYKDELNIPRFDLAVDFGVLYFLTKPLYHVLSFLGNFFKQETNTPVSFGIALIVLTVIVRLVTFPLQNKSYRSMNKMKDIAPKMQELKELHGKDKVKFQHEVMALYKKEKINPASGCLPILIQIPIFFALYKVIYITLDMRHAPFWGWIHDLSAPDSTNIFTLFGLIQWDVPSFLAIGAWPLLYGFTMWIQQSLNPKPEDPTQQQIFTMLPWLFTIMFAQFPAGLVIYYTWSNILGIVQQYSLRRLNPGMAPAKKKRQRKKKDDIHTTAN